MRKSAKCVLATLLIFCFTGNVNAAECSYEKQVELNNLAATVKATYEEVEIDTGETYFDDMKFDENGENVVLKRYEKGFNIKLLNLPDNLSVEASNDLGFQKNISYLETNKGSIDIGTNKANQVINYTFKIKVATGACIGKELRVINLVVPMYNSYSETSYCQENPNFEYCNEYTTNAVQMDYIKFDEAVKKYESNKKEEEKKEEQTKIERILEIIKENKIIIISGISLIVIIVSGVIVIKRRRRLI